MLLPRAAFLALRLSPCLLPKLSVKNRKGGHFMNQQLRQDAARIIADAIHAVLPDQAVIRALEAASFPGRIRLVAAGKAAWQMAQAASKTLGDSLECGVICTKYGHCGGKLPKITCCEGGHPIPDENSLRATDKRLPRLIRAVSVGSPIS